MADLLLDVSLRLLSGRAAPSQSAAYAFLAFDVPRPCGRLTVTLAFESASVVQLPLALFDPQGRVRYMKASEPASGAVSQAAAVGAALAEPGAIPGPVGAGRWKLVVHKRILPAELAVRVSASASGAAGAAAGYALDGLAFADATADSRPGWYCGELHLHSSESTGRTAVDVIRDAAVARGLDFLALTDHYAASHWLRIEELEAAGRRPLFLRSMEIAGSRGHANFHGVTEWFDPFVDDDDGALAAFLGPGSTGSMAAAAVRVHRMGGLLCVNHPLSGGAAWRYADFPFEQADLIEIACLPDGPTSFLYPTLWDRLLCSGIRITGVGSSDSHDPLQDGPWALGRIRNWVRASSLSRSGILEGLRRGRVYVAVGEAQLDFSAEPALGRDAVYGMGDTVPLAPGEGCRFRVALTSHTSGNLFVILNGLIHDVVHLPAGEGPDETSFPVGSAELRGRAGESCVRIEFHEDLEKARYHGMAFRDHRSARLLSNPIWTRQDLTRGAVSPAAAARDQPTGNGLRSLKSAWCQ